MGIWQLIVGILNITPTIFSLLGSLQFSQFWGVIESIVYVHSLIAALIWFFFGILFPEAMLISQALIVRATKLYDLVEQAQAPEPTHSRDYLLQYIRNLPPELLQELES